MVSQSETTHMPYTLKSCVSYLRIWSTIGLLLSAYATYVEIRAENDANYVAMCDLAKKISCTAVFNTEYGKGFGLMQFIFGSSSSILNPPNGILGIFFYSILWTTTLRLNFHATVIQLSMCFAANLISIYLAYLLYWVLDNFCIVCVLIYVVNFFCLRNAWRILHFLRKKCKSTEKRPVAANKGA